MIFLSDISTLPLSRALWIGGVLPGYPLARSCQQLLHTRQSTWADDRKARAARALRAIRVRLFTSRKGLFHNRNRPQAYRGMRVARGAAELFHFSTAPPITTTGCASLLGKKQTGGCS